MPVYTASGGIVGEPAESLGRLFGYQEPGVDIAEAKWWWAAISRDWPSEDPTTLTLQDRQASIVYPSLIAAVSDASHPSWRARSLSVYRFWRDLGYAVGALSAGVIADAFGLSWAIASAGTLTFLSGIVVAAWMREGLGDHRASKKGATRS